jgi:hypothetical protein
MNCIVFSGVGASGGGELYGWPMSHSMLGLSLALQCHLWVSHVHGSSHVGIVFSCGDLLYEPAFISI